MGYNPFIFLIAGVLAVFALLALVYPYAPFHKRKIALVVGVIAGFACLASSPLFRPTKVIVQVPASARTAEIQSPPMQEISASPGAEIKWVTAGRLNKRTCPTVNCGMTGGVYSGEAVEIFEWQDGWARISDYTDAGCTDGLTPRIESGVSACDEANGIIDGKLAEWVAGNYLTDQKP